MISARQLDELVNAFHLPKRNSTEKRIILQQFSNWTPRSSRHRRLSLPVSSCCSMPPKRQQGRPDDRSTRVELGGWLFRREPGLRHRSARRHGVLAGGRGAARGNSSDQAFFLHSTRCARLWTLPFSTREL